MRTITSPTRNQMESKAQTDLLLMACKITHPDLAEPIRVITEDVNGVSYLNGKIVNYKWDDGTGLQIFQGFPFVWKLVTDDDNPPKAQISFSNVDRRIGAAIIDSSIVRAQIRLTGLVLSDFSSTVDSSNSRTPLGTPSTWYNADWLFLSNCQGDDATISGDLTSYDIANEPCPSIRTTFDRTPGLYRG